MMFLEQFRDLLQHDIDDAHGRAAIPGDQAARMYAAALVRPMLIHRQARKRLRPVQDNAAIFYCVAILQAKFLQILFCFDR